MLYRSHRLFQFVMEVLPTLPRLIGSLGFYPTIISQTKKRKQDPHALQPEVRLWWLLYTAPCLTIGLFGFAATSIGPPRVHWIAPVGAPPFPLYDCGSPLVC